MTFGVTVTDSLIVGLNSSQATRVGPTAPLMRARNGAHQPKSPSATTQRWRRRSGTRLLLVGHGRDDLNRGGPLRQGATERPSPGPVEDAEAMPTIGVPSRIRTVSAQGGSSRRHDRRGAETTLLMRPAITHAAEHRSAALQRGAPEATSRYAQGHPAACGWWRLQQPWTRSTSRGAARTYDQTPASPVGPGEFARGQNVRIGGTICCVMSLHHRKSARARLPRRMAHRAGACGSLFWRLQTVAFRHEVGIPTAACGRRRPGNAARSVGRRRAARQFPRFGAG